MITVKRLHPISNENGGTQCYTYDIRQKTQLRSKKDLYEIIDESGLPYLVNGARGHYHLTVFGENETIYLELGEAL